MRDGDAIRLTIREPSGAEQELRLDRDVIRIGRARDCDLPLESGYVSRYHARLERSGHDWALVDEGSKNGVILNGRRITGTHPLYSGDTMRMGDFTIIFTVADTQDEDRTIIYPFAAADLDAELLARRGQAVASAAPDAEPPLQPLALQRETTVPAPAKPLHAQDTKPTPAAPPPSSLERRELAAFTLLTAEAEAGADEQSLGDATWQPGAWDVPMLDRLVSRLDRKLRDYDKRTIARDAAGRYRIADPAGAQ